MKKVRVAVVWQLASCAQVTWRMPNLEGIMVSLHQDVFFQGHNVTGTWFNHVQYCANLWARTERWNYHKQVVCWQGWSISWSRLDYVEQTEMVTVAMVVYRVFFAMNFKPSQHGNPWTHSLDHVWSVVWCFVIMIKAFPQNTWWMWVKPHQIRYQYIYTYIYINDSSMLVCLQRCFFYMCHHKKIGPHPGRHRSSGSMFGHSRPSQGGKFCGLS